MSEEGDIDVESAEDVPDIAVEATATTAEDKSDIYSPTGGPLDKRAHHNALERRRRDHIKDSFHSLRDSIPSLQGEKISRAHILNKATEYIRNMQMDGSTRQNEIQEMKRKNEVLEEQVRALEAAKALGSTESAEEILQAVAEKVEGRQRQQQTKASSTTAGGKTEQSTPEKAGKTSQQASSGSSKQSAPVAKVGETSSALSNHINILTKNQSLLSALQKNLSSPNLSASIKSLAARVLASPLGRTQVNTSGNLPRGIVTATTVPKGSSFTSSPLPSTLQQQLQQAKPTQVPKQSAAKSAADISSKLPKTNTCPPGGNDDIPNTSNCTSDAPALICNPTTQDKTGVDSSALTSSGNPVSKSGASLVSTASISSSSSSVHPTDVVATSLASQLMDAHSLLQQQGAGASTSPSRIGNSTVPLIPPELFAQVSSFLNLPSHTTPLPAGSKSATGISASTEINTSVSESASQESLSTEVVLKGIKRPNTTQEMDSEHSVKKIHLEA